MLVEIQVLPSPVGTDTARYPHVDAAIARIDGSTTLPVQIYSMVRSGVSPEINAVSTVLLVATSLLLLAAHRLEQGRGS